MNPCIKTGAVVLFVDYRQKLMADIYQIGSSFVVRTNPNCLDKGTSLGDGFPVTHEVRSSPMFAEFWRDDLGVFVIDSAMFRTLSTEKEN